jgi:Acyl-protein synthetase, LuxE
MNELTNYSTLETRIFKATQENFESLALEIFRFQYAYNNDYREYCKTLQIQPGQITAISHIPFLPIQFFKSRKIQTTAFEPEVIFESSGTTGTINSKHYIKETRIYQTSFLRTFELFYGDVKAYSIIGLLPAYLERKNSSLVWMVNELIKLSGNATSGFYLYDHAKLKAVLQANERNRQKTLLIGVTYALLDFFENNPMSLEFTIIMETGGMKGRRNEITRQTLHDILQQRSGAKTIHAEYGMTELLSQAYSQAGGIFNCPPWMKIVVRDEDDPLTVNFPRTAPVGGIANVIDFANLYSCSFIATDDYAKLNPDGSFEIIGRVDTSDIRGCSLMIV